MLGPLERKALALRRKYQPYNSLDNKTAYLSAAKDFHQSILRLKHEHWKAFLIELDDEKLFTAARFTIGPPAPSIIPPIRKPDGSLTSDPASQADLIFRGTSAPTVDIDLEDVANPPLHTSASPRLSPFRRH